MPFVIKPTKGWVPLKLGEVWDCHELILFLAWRDISARYRQTAIGACWALLQPTLTMVVFTIIFGRFAKLPADGLPYPLFIYTAMLPWQYFATATINSGSSLVLSANLLTKVYFPRLVIPIAAVLPAMLDFVIASLFLVGLMTFYHVQATLHLVWLPCFCLMAIITTLGTGIWLSALSIEFRDIRHLTPFVLQTWMFLSPVAYSSSIVPEHLRPIYGLNPMTSVIDGFRWCLLGTKSPPGVSTLVSLTVALLLLVTGAFYFRRLEKRFADVI